MRIELKTLTMMSEIITLTHNSLKAKTGGGNMIYTIAGPKQ